MPYENLPHILVPLPTSSLLNPMMGDFNTIANDFLSKLAEMADGKTIVRMLGVLNRVTLDALGKVIPEDVPDVCLHYWPFVGEFTDNRWIPLTKDHSAGHLGFSFLNKRSVGDLRRPGAHCNDVVRNNPCEYKAWNLC